MQTEIISAQVGNKWVAFRDGADLAEFDEGKLKSWSIESRDCTTGSLIEAGEKVNVPAASPSFALSYNIAFAEVHIQKVAGPSASEKPDRAFLEALPVAILTAFVNRADTSQSLTKDEYNGLKKKPTPSTGETGDSALN